MKLRDEAHVALLWFWIRDLFPQENKVFFNLTVSPKPDGTTWLTGNRPHFPKVCRFQVPVSRSVSCILPRT